MKWQMQDDAVASNPIIAGFCRSRRAGARIAVE